MLNGKIAKLEAVKELNERLATIAGFAGLSSITGLSFRSNKLQKKSNRIIGREKEKSDNLLLNILPERIANELKETGATQARHFGQVTVLFTDFVNYTVAAQRMSTRELVDELDHRFKAFDRIVDQYGIENIKTIGDAYLAVGRPFRVGS
jgi:adenylate cyclase